MTFTNIDDFHEEKSCTYKNEIYSVRDNGAVLRHSGNSKRKRKIDDIWTFGTLDDKDFMRIGGEKINRIVATAFYGAPTSEQYVVFHKNYNSQDNRVKNLSWVTKFEFKILQPSIQSQLQLLLDMKIEKILSDISILQTIDVPNLNLDEICYTGRSRFLLAKICRLEIFNTTGNRRFELAYTIKQRCLKKS